ncbi:SdiA-regulated domain-containing protein [Flammeovirga yaeyamensis]|uniref:SdiA-regulated domain-containing protein n=1 Tax=Flammeovirga yaeyamensis TaxID=367791 RepID=A0AAX1N723_9BACT|nr:SdiA-regulated domain-containing protein [Flammeovirga yaeyamensis]MBB3701130.1 uncharacterized protein YjiK [Flammeovirga yaeyamensis]NMF38402.1 hypothetical protein [Flammeovirga yaeyamensis]QWG01598.1 SdiA-regulated domain-containing protein [Flammeovirga yaeyamensis]
MRTIHYILLIVQLTVYSNSIFAQKIKQLEFLEIKQLENYQGRFDLSGISKKEKEIVVVADKFENNFIYSLHQKDNSFEVKASYKLDIPGKIDLEGISVYKNKAYLINEADNEVYVYDFDKKATNKLPIDWSSLFLPRTEWLKNTGFEGVAVDGKAGLLYLAKERQPSFIIVVDLNTNKIVREFTLKRNCSKDISDMYLYKGDLFILERNARCIAQYDLEKNKIVQHYSYEKSVVTNKQKLFEPEKYGMAEALMIVDDEVWLGYDNNGVKVSDEAKLRYGIKGDKPVLLKFKFDF